MNVVDIKPRNEEVKETLKKVMDENPSLEAVVIIGIYKDGSQLLQTSQCNAHEKAFMCQFFNAWMVRCFNLGSDE